MLYRTWPAPSMISDSIVHRCVKEPCNWHDIVWKMPVAVMKRAQTKRLFWSTTKLSHRPKWNLKNPLHLLLLGCTRLKSSASSCLSCWGKKVWILAGFELMTFTSGPSSLSTSSPVRLVLLQRPLHLRKTSVASGPDFEPRLNKNVFLPNSIPRWDKCFYPAVIFSIYINVITTRVSTIVPFAQ